MVSSASGTAVRSRPRSSPRRFPVRSHDGGELRGSLGPMRVRLIAVGTRLPAWVRGACEDYLARLTSRPAISLVEIEPGPRYGDRKSTRLNSSHLVISYAGF